MERMGAFHLRGEVKRGRQQERLKSPLKGLRPAVRLRGRKGSIRAARVSKRPVNRSLTVAARIEGCGGWESCVPAGGRPAETPLRRDFSRQPSALLIRPQTEIHRERIIGAFLFAETWQAWTADEAGRFLESLARFGVNAIFTEAESYRADLLALAHQMGLRWFGSIACFSDHAHGHQLLQERPELWPIEEDGQPRRPMEWYIGVTPTFEDYNRSRLELIEQLVRMFELDGFFLDFIRWPLHWELECRPGAPRPRQSSFDAHTLARFQAEMGIRLPAHLRDTAAQAAWILAHHAAEWTEFKCRVITDFVAQAAQRVRAARGTGFPLGLFLVPLPEAERAQLVGQRVSALAPLVTLLAPMAYHAILHRSPAWVRALLEEVVALAPGQVLPVLQVDSAEGAELGADWGPPLPAAEWEEVVEIARSFPEVCGLIAFTGTALRRDDRGERLRRQVARWG